ncbi:MAG: hypothetical protein ABI388_08115 [Bacteroidia bacterium]
MKTSFYILNLWLLPLFCFCQYNSKQTDWQKDNLVGNVKTLKQTYYYAKETDGKIIQGAMYYKYDYNYLKTYNNKGFLIEKTIYNGDTLNGKYHPESLNYRMVFIYDDRGNLITRKTYLYNDSLNCETKYLYDAKGNLIAFNFFYVKYNLIIKGDSNSYNSFGNRVETKEYNEDGSQRDRYVYRHDSIGNIIEWKAYDEKDVLDARYKCKYDSSGNIIKRSSFLSDTCFLEEDSCVYDYETYTYDKKRNLTGYNKYKGSGQIYSRSNYKYDEKNNLVEDIGVFGDFSTIDTFTYEYDNKGNWIKKMVYEHREYIVITRKIEYY